MGLSMKENGKMICNMVKGSRPGPMELDIMLENLNQA
jgi:hypothetical protein